MEVFFTPNHLDVAQWWAVKGIRQRGRPIKTWWDCVKDDMESLGLSQMDAQFRNKWRRIKRPVNLGSPGKMAVETVCVCLYNGCLGGVYE